MIPAPSPMTSARSDVVGSLLRPPHLLAAQKRVAEGAITAAEFKKIEDNAVDQAIALQEEAGLEVVTDGEMRRQWFQSQMTAAVDGFGEHTLDAFLWGEWRGEPQWGIGASTAHQTWVWWASSAGGATSRQRSSPICAHAPATSPRLRCLLQASG